MSTLPRTFDTLSQFATAQIIFGSYQAGLWTPFQENLDIELDVKSFATSSKLDGRLLAGYCEYLTRRGLMEATGSSESVRYKLSPEGRELVGGDWLGYYVFLVGGYGEVLSKSGPLLTKEITYGPDLTRNGHYVALGSELNGRSPNHKSFEAILSLTDKGDRPESVLDLGCGSGAFLLMLLERTGAKTGYGIDINSDSCKLARKNMEEAGRGDSVDIFDEDAGKVLTSHPELEGSVDMITAMFLVHEFFSAGFDESVRRLRDIRRVLRPETGRFVIMDKHTDVLEGDEAPPYFTEFKLIHDLTSQVLYKKEEWHELLKASGFVIAEEKVLARHTGTILFDCRRGPNA